MRYYNAKNDFRPIEIFGRKIYYLDIIDFTDEELGDKEFKSFVDRGYFKPYDVEIPETTEEPQAKKKRKRKSETPETAESVESEVTENNKEVE